MKNEENIVMNVTADNGFSDLVADKAVGLTKSNNGKTMMEAMVISQERIASDIYSMWIDAEVIAKRCKPGQFVSLYTSDKSHLLPRPISICEVKENAIRIVYRVSGSGTKEFSKYMANRYVRLMGPLGNGFPLANEKKTAMLIGGGIGIPPMLYLAKSLPGSIKIVAGYRDEMFLDDSLAAWGSVYVATEDGKHGIKGTVIDAIKAHQLTADVIYACGPKPMLKAVCDYSLTMGIEGYISLEERMACGIGACLACVCKTDKKDSYTNVNNTRICKDGPVFPIGEVIL